MASRYQHRFVAVAFRENFNLADLPAEWKEEIIVTDSKESRARKLGSGEVYAYRYGALTFVDVSDDERAREIERLKVYLSIAENSKVITEEFTVQESENMKPRVEHNRVILDELTFERQAVIAKIISQSVAMECYEQLVESARSKVAPLIDQLEERGGISRAPSHLYKKIGYVMGIHSEVIGMLHLLDKPDLIWEDKVMDSLYNELRAAFDLGDRFRALEYKLESIKDNITILADTVKDSRSHSLETAIVAMIAVEICFTLMSRFHILGW